MCNAVGKQMRQDIAADSHSIVQCTLAENLESTIARHAEELLASYGLESNLALLLKDFGNTNKTEIQFVHTRLYTKLRPM